MDQKLLKDILDKHQKWLNKEKGGERANLSCANLSGANLSGANLRGANLIGANIDYSCWSLWCGSLHAQIEDRIACQLIYHVCSTIASSPAVSDEIKRIMLSEPVIEVANQFHRVENCGRLAVNVSNDKE